MRFFRFCEHFGIPLGTIFEKNINLCFRGSILGLILGGVGGTGLAPKPEESEASEESR